MRTTILVGVALALVSLPVALAAGPDFYGVEITYNGAFAPSWTASPELNCISGGVPAPEVEVRCNSTTFSATLCKSPSTSADLIGLNANLVSRAICGAGQQADCTATTAGLDLTESCSEEQSALGSGLPFVCHLTPSGAIVRYVVECKAYFG